MLRCWVLGMLVACAARTPAVSTTPKLAPGSSVERDISDGQTHQYEVSLAADTVMFAEIDQLGADVTLSTFGPDGGQLATFDSPTGSKGTELVRVEAAKAGTYRIDVTTFPGQTGKYRARVVEVVTRVELEAREAKERAAIDKFFADRRELVDGVVGWAKQNAIGDDLAGIDKLIGNARVIALGEADHGVREYLAYRNRLAKHLIEKQVVTAILVETGFTEATVVDDYVMGVGAASIRDVAPSLFMWAMPAAPRDNIDLIEWLRAYNAKATRKVHVYGVDVTGGRDGLYKESRRAVDAALGYLAKADAAAHAKLEPRLSPLLPSFTTAGYLELDVAKRGELRSAIEALLDAFKTQRDSVEMRRARQSAAMASVVETFLRTTVARSTKEDLADVSMDGIRDATMAANAMWALGEEGPASRVFLFAHNAHLRRAAVVAWPSKMQMFPSMGEYLSKSLRDKLVVIGFLHGDGPPTATLDGLFAKVGLPSFVVDLRTAPETVRAGFNQSWEFRLDGFRALGLKPAWSAIPARCFDALAFTATSTDAALVR
ncbi:MAG TPA: erythromycin esterase family protein [Kofleriaceae bacterium]